VCQLRPAPGGAEERRGWQGHRAGKVAPPERMLRRVRGTQWHPEASPVAHRNVRGINGHATGYIRPIF